jgi:hypothetical protein
VFSRAVAWLVGAWIDWLESVGVIDGPDDE